MEKPLVYLLFFYLIYLGMIGVFMFVIRFKAVKAGRINPKYFKTYDMDSPRDLKALENHWTNQFQVPMLFFVTCTLAIQLNADSFNFFILACVFVGSRLIHSFIHLGSNKVLYRAGSFFFGYFVLLSQWGVILNSL